MLRELGWFLDNYPWWSFWFSLLMFPMLAIIGSICSALIGMVTKK